MSRAWILSNFKNIPGAKEVGGAWEVSQFDWLEWKAYVGTGQRRYGPNPVVDRMMAGLESEEEMRAHDPLGMDVGVEAERGAAAI